MEKTKQNNLNGRFSFSIHDINQGLPFANNKFDTVLLVSVLYFVYDPFFVIDEIYRVLKPEGILILQVPNIAYLKYRIKFFWVYYLLCPPFFILIGRK